MQFVAKLIAALFIPSPIAFNDHHLVSKASKYETKKRTNEKTSRSLSEKKKIFLSFPSFVKKGLKYHNFNVPIDFHIVCT